MKLVLALAGTAAAFVAPVRTSVRSKNFRRRRLIRRAPALDVEAVDRALLRVVGGSADQLDALPPSCGHHWAGYS